MGTTADIKTIFGKAIALEATAERAAYLDEVCAGNPQLRAEVESLLKAHQAVGPFLRDLSPSPVATIDEPRISEAPGTVIGPYKLLEQIGEGGFGVVFMAEQTQPVRRKVALKVLKPGMDTRQVVARFEAERQALAIMDHPNIAKVLDGGATASGRPFFVMDLVKGVPITEHCDQNHLTPRERLELVVSVCQAVQHAHQKGIIHRDLKPSNVLVTMHPGAPGLVKVIDFGVAKALGQELTDKTLFTGFAQMIGTPLYMSPEQAAQSGLDIDTRSDIYSLGVLLYELLTGTTPFEKERFQQAAYDEVRRIIREEEPPKPSTRLSGSVALPAIAAQRQMAPVKLARLVRGELDWIVMKALDKDRNRRYETANGFAMDIQRYLAEEPVLAGAPTANYRLRKFLRRNKGPVLAASVVLLVLVGGIVGTTWQALVASRQRDRAVQAEARAREETQAKDQARRDVDEQRRLADERRRQASLATMTMFSSLEILGDSSGWPASGEPRLRRLLEAALPKLGEDHPYTLAVMFTLADFLRSQGKLTEAESLVRRVLDTTRRVDGEDNLDTAVVLATLAGLLEQQGKLAQAEPLYRQAIETRRRIRPSGESEIGYLLLSLGRLLVERAEPKPAEPLLREALDIYRRVLPEAETPIGVAMHAEAAEARSLLGGCLAAQGRYADAEPLLLEGYEEMKQREAGMPPSDKVRLTEALERLVQLYNAWGKRDEAAKWRKELESMKSNKPMKQ